MSLVGARFALIHRTTVLRSSGATNPWGQQKSGESDWQIAIDDLACRGWVYSARENTGDAPGGGGSRSVTEIEDRRVIVPVGSDVRKSDRIGDVTYRDTMFIEGPMTVEAIIRRVDQIELVLKRVR